MTKSNRVLKKLEVEAHIVPCSEQRSELGSDIYHGGVVYSRHASVDPARYHQGLLDLVLKAGATVVTKCPVTAIEKQASGFRVTTRTVRT